MWNWLWYDSSSLIKDLLIRPSLFKSFLLNLKDILFEQYIYFIVHCCNFCLKTISFPLVKFEIFKHSQKTSKVEFLGKVRCKLCRTANKTFYTQKKDLTMIYVYYCHQSSDLKYLIFFYFFFILFPYLYVYKVIYMAAAFFVSHGR